MSVLNFFKESDKSLVAERMQQVFSVGHSMVEASFLGKDQIDMQNDSFINREMKFARHWLANKGIMMPEEDKNPVDVELSSFFDDCRTGNRPKSDLEVGLADSAGVILANRAMYEERRVYYNEINQPAAPPKKA